MDASTPSAQQKLVLDGASTSGLGITLHPLPILNISEHHVRTRLQQRSEEYKIIGGLLGIQNGREVEIVNSYELALVRERDEGRMDVVEEQAAGGRGHSGKMVDWAFFEERTSNFKQVFPTLEFLGWYSVGAAPTALDLSLHKQFISKNESPLFLLLSPTSPPTATTELASSTEEADLPVTIFESVHLAGPRSTALATPSEGKAPAKGRGEAAAVEDNSGTVAFQVGKWRIETGEAERIAVEGVGKAGLEGSKGESSLIPNLTTQRNAIQMLSNRTQVLLEYVRGVSEGRLARDEEVLRMIGSLLAGLPVEEGEEFREEFMTEYADVQLTSYLATLTKSAHSLNNFTDKFTSLHALAGSDRLEGGAMGMFAGGADSFMGGMAKGGSGGGRNGGRKLGGAGGGRFT